MARWVPLILLALGLAGCTSSTAKAPINLAHLVPLTGPDRDRGRQAQQGVLLAVEDINADDKGVLGRPLQVRNIDTRGDADTAQGETVRLLSLERTVAVITGPDAANSEVLVRTAHPYTTMTIVPSELTEAPTTDDVLCLGVNPRKRGQALAQFAAKELKAKRAVVLTERRSAGAKTTDKPDSDAASREAARTDKRNPVAASVAAGFLDEWPRTVPPSAEEWPVAELGADKDLPKRLAEANADVVFVCSSVPDFVKLRSQCEAATLTAPLLYGGEDVGVRPLQTNSAGPDVYLATLFTAESLADKGKAFAKKYEERFHEPPDLAAFQAYDAVRLVAETMQRDNVVAVPELRASLQRLDKFDSLLGTVTWKDHQAKRPLYLVQLHDKDSPIVKPIKADD
jgi:branched-chain amino acid transport system substrate-binding protein